MSKECNKKKKGSEFSSRLEFIVAGAEFKSHDSSSHFKKLAFKNGCQKETELKLQTL